MKISRPKWGKKLNTYKPNNWIDQNLGSMDTDTSMGKDMGMTRSHEEFSKNYNVKLPVRYPKCGVHAS